MTVNLLSYRLKGDYPMKRGGRHVQPGEAVEMTEKEAAPYVASGRLALDAPTSGKDEGANTGSQAAGADPGAPGAGAPASAPEPTPAPAATDSPAAAGGPSGAGAAPGVKPDEKPAKPAKKKKANA